ncbi:NEK protein kinase [Helicocarpus griseus UAMH5409]|uniref:non-specific serine/threonine protein kinase n=1 Tax=Helicocarpus griseus UAMH5409 TaxID=1447875 RepID=A0A2B7XR06_9EURO|nr:NEK protein kinase [Helicocarpus griseus UAMH5409]
MTEVIETSYRVPDVPPDKGDSLDDWIEGDLNLLFPPEQFHFAPSLAEPALPERPQEQKPRQQQQQQKHSKSRQHKLQQHQPRNPTIPPGFLKRFRKLYKPSNESRPGPGPAAIRYYEHDLTRNDLPLDEKWEYAEEFQKQLKVFVELTETTEFPEGSEDNIDEVGYDVRWKDQGVASEDNQWIYLGELGSGGFGCVQCWEWWPFGKMGPILFAVKDTQSDNYWNDYCSEGNLTRRLNAAGCPNVVKVYDWIDLGPMPAQEIVAQRYFRIMYEYYDGGSLARLYHDYMKYRILLPEAFLWHVFHQMATALLYCAHGHIGPERKLGWEEIIHKDVKPGNILLGVAPPPNSDELYPTCYLGDFGLAYTVPNEDVRAYKKCYGMEGTVEYLPPEAVDRSTAAPLTPKIDIYSLTLSIREAIDSALTIYTAAEINALRKLADGDRYLPYSVDLLNFCRAAGSRRARRRPDIYSLWQVTGQQARKWKKKTLENRRRAREAGKSCFEGMMLFDEEVRERYKKDGAFRKEFLEVASWTHANKGVVRFGKEMVRMAKENRIVRNEAGYVIMLKGEDDEGWVDVEDAAMSEGAEPRGEWEPWEWVKK